MKSIKGDSDNESLVSSDSHQFSESPEDPIIDDTQLSCLSYQPLNLNHLRKLNDKDTVRSLI